MTFSSFMMIFKFSLISKKIDLDFQSQGLYQRLSTKTDTTNTMTTTAMTLTELRMKNNTPSRFLKQDDIELIVFLFENASSHAEFEAELRKKFEKKCDICEVERDLETGECDCRIVECAACGEKHPKYELNLVEGVCYRQFECDPSCYECGECLDDPATHIFCFSKEGEEDRILCCECGQDFHKEYKSEGWTRDDDSDDSDDTPATERVWYKGEVKKGEVEIYDICEFCRGVMDKEYQRSDRVFLMDYDDFLSTPQECPRCEYERQECLKEVEEEDEEEDELCSAIDASGNALW